MSDSVWPADTNRRIPTGSLHLSKFDFFDVTMKTESSFNIWWRKDIGICLWKVHDDSNWKYSWSLLELTRSTMVSRRSRSVAEEPVDFFSLRKTMGDSTWLEISSPGISNNSADWTQRVIGHFVGYLNGFTIPILSWLMMYSKTTVTIYASQLSQHCIDIGPSIILVTTEKEPVQLDQIYNPIGRG
jgi:hypothetical protein